MQTPPDHFWLFGYGSLIWKQGFSFSKAATAGLDGYVRRFWQGSPDHRGTPEAMGRVVTLVENANTICWGVAFAIAEHDRQQVLAKLDHRESGGYKQKSVTLHLRDEGRDVEGLVYYAGPTNPHYLGPAPFDEMAAHIHQSVGPSGPNREYFDNLRQALDQRGIVDDHLEQLAHYLPR